MKQKTFIVPKQDTHPLHLIPGQGRAAPANEEIPLRERPPIVVSPGLMISFSRAGILITGAVMAAFTVWSFIRVALFLAWLMGYRALDLHFVVLGGFGGVLNAIAGFASGVALLCGGLFTWAFYNWVRFHGPDRRREPSPITDTHIATHYGLPHPQVWRWQFARRLRAHHDDRGVVVGAESEMGTWIRGDEEAPIIIKPNTFDILYLSARSKRGRKNSEPDRRA